MEEAVATINFPRAAPLVKICIGTKVCDYLVGKSEGDGFADGHAEPIVVNTRAFDPVRGQGDLGHVF